MHESFLTRPVVITSSAAALWLHEPGAHGVPSRQPSSVWNDSRLRSCHRHAAAPCHDMFVDDGGRPTCLKQFFSHCCLLAVSVAGRTDIGHGMFEEVISTVAP